MPIVMASTECGMEIEEVAEKNPEKIIKLVVDPSVGLMPNQAREIIFRLGLPKECLKQGVAFLTALWKAYEEEDSSMLEINPLVLTGDNRLMALDCKFTLDDNALFRHKDHAALQDKSEEDPLELRAAEYNLNYVKLDGNVGCMVNGAGLAMATMDIVKIAGAEPANFLDVGGGATKEKVTEREGDLREHFRRHRAVRPGGERDCCGGQGGLHRCAADRASARNERGGGEEDPGGFGAFAYGGRGTGGRREKGGFRHRGLTVTIRHTKDEHYGDTC